MAKTYLNSLIIKQGQYGLKVSAKVEELIKEIKENASGDWINIDINERQTPSDKGVTHYASVFKKDQNDPY